VSSAEHRSSEPKSGSIELIMSLVRSALVIVLQVLRSVPWSTLAAGERAFAYVLFALFGASLIPFLLPPSLLLTVTLSIPPFILILLRASRDLRKMETSVKNEENCLSTFVANAASYWAKIKDHPGDTISEQDVLGLVPEGTRRSAIYAKSLIEDIAKGKVYLIDAPQDSVLRPYRDDLEAQFSNAASFGNLSIKVGILGTFCGFIFALQHLSQLFANLAEERPDLMAVTLQNLAYAFVKSLFGLGFSILIAIQASKVRRPLDEFYSRFDDVLRFGREFINRMILADPAIHTSLVQVRNSLKQMEQRLFDHSGTVAQALQDHGQLINEQTKTFSLAAQGMVDVQRTWEQALSKLNEAGKSFDHRTSGAIARVEQGVESATVKFQVALSSLAEAREEFARSSGILLEAVTASELGWSKRFDTLISEIANQDKKFGQWASIASGGFEAVREQMSIIENNLKAAYSAAQSSNNHSKELTSALGRLDATLQQHSLLRPSKLRWWRWLLLAIVSIAALAIASTYLFDDPFELKEYLLRLHEVKLPKS
jgi:hypothetical protein